MHAGRSVVKSCILNTPLVAHPLSARSMALRLWHNVTILFYSNELLGQCLAPQGAVGPADGLLVSCGVSRCVGLAAGSPRALRAGGATGALLASPPNMRV
jgi:hypothetical protein